MIKGSKPWRYTGKEENMQREDIKNLVKKWWDIYEDESLDYKNIIADHDKNAPSAAWLALELFFFYVAISFSIVKCYHLSLFFERQVG